VLLLELFTDADIGTMITPASNDTRRRAPVTGMTPPEQERSDQGEASNA
jgi:hypothetical protein